jgi:hypothetical protein
MRAGLAPFARRCDLRAKLGRFVQGGASKPTWSGTGGRASRFEQGQKAPGNPPLQGRSFGDGVGKGPPPRSDFSTPVANRPGRCAKKAPAESAGALSWPVGSKVQFKSSGARPPAMPPLSAPCLRRYDRTIRVVRRILDADFVFGLVADQV